MVNTLLLQPNIVFRKGNSRLRAKPPIRYRKFLAQLILNINNSKEIHQNSGETNYSSGSDDYPGGFAVQTLPPPEYSSNPTSTRDQSKVQARQVEVKEETHPLSPEKSLKTSEGLGSLVAQTGYLDEKVF